MAAAAKHSNMSAVEEFVTPARVEALNTELRSRGISAEQIIAVHALEGQPLVHGIEAKFRVLYRN